MHPQPEAGEAPSPAAPPTHPVTRDDFRSRLAATTSAADPAAGLYGPDSMMWRINRHTLVYVLGITQAAFMDVAHPAIANGIADHSTLFTDPRARGHQTYSMITSIVFGATDDVTRASRALFSRHERVRGQARAESGEYATAREYVANEGEVLLWVHATMWWVRLRLYEDIVGPLSAEERERFYQETKRFADCFAIPVHLLPEDHAAWDAYVRDGRPGVLAASDDSRRIMGFLAAQIPLPVRAHLLAFNSVMLPDSAREILGLPELSRRTLRRHRRMLRVVRFFQAVLPAPLKELPPYRLATARLEGRTPDRLTRKLADRLAGRPTPPRTQKDPR